MDLYDQLDKRLGRARSKKKKATKGSHKYWWGYKIIYESTVSEDEDDDFSSD